MRARFFRQRARVLTALFFVFFAALCLRVIVVMMFPRTPTQKHPLAVREQEELEHFQVQMIDDGRGRIRYVNGQPWSGHVEISSSGTHIHNESVPPADGVIVVGRVGKPDVWPSSHRLIQEQGRSGLEYTFDAVLSGEQPGYSGRLLVGNTQDKAEDMSYQNTVRPGADVLTTVDAAWQQRLDNILQSSGTRQGAMVVVDVKTADILAMSSVSTDQRNLAVTPVRPGSVMKLVTAASAIDAYSAGVSSVFDCTGQLMTPSVRMHCWRVHGRETFLQALASSCDVAFAEIGMRTGREALERTAKRCGVYGTGLQSFQGHPILPEALPGRLFLGRSADAGLLANTAIGQQDTILSPLQGALLAAAVANHGMYRDAVLVQAVKHTSQSFMPILGTDAHRAFSVYAANVLAKGMWEATHSPFGTAYLLHDEDVAVKTGTAELPNHRVNAWSVGFFPANSPRYAFVAVSENEETTRAHQQVFDMDRKLLQPNI